MTMSRIFSIGFCFVAVMASGSCARKPPPSVASSEQVAMPAKATIEASALEDVLEVDANAAFEGDPNAAMSIAEGFADAEKFEPAKYWYQIAAENGNPQAKQALAILLRKSNCRRAIFWLESYLSHGADVIGAEPYVQTQASLKGYREECSRNKKNT